MTNGGKMSNKKSKILVAILLILTIILPILWLLFINLEIEKADFVRDVYLDKSSVEIFGDNKVALRFNLKNNSDIDYGGKFLHICPVENGQYGSYYIDYDLPFIGAHQTLPVYVQTELPKEKFQDIKIQVRDEDNTNEYISLKDSQIYSSFPRIFYFVGWGVVIMACVLMFNKAIIIQLRGIKNPSQTKIKKEK